MFCGQVRTFGEGHDMQRKRSNDACETDVHMVLLNYRTPIQYLMQSPTDDTHDEKPIKRIEKTTHATCFQVGLLQFNSWYQHPSTINWTVTYYYVSILDFSDTDDWCVASPCSPEDRPLNITAISGTFASTNYPGSYDNNADCQWLIISVYQVRYHRQTWYATFAQFETSMHLLYSG